MKIERLAGMSGTPTLEGWLEDDQWYVCQSTQTQNTEQLYGPICKTKLGAIRAWNTMVRCIRRANATVGYTYKGDTP